MRWLTLFLLCAGFWAGSALGAPNVLVILTDDQRWDALGVVQRELVSSDNYDLSPATIKNDP